MATLDVEDTIVAVASPPGGALRGIIRVSGPDMIGCLAPICVDPQNLRPCLIDRLDSRVALSCSLVLNKITRLPGRLLIWPDHRSYTRQPTAEFHTIGSPPILEMATAAICRSGARLAERGEFTLRAFLSGRIDLTQAEAVLAVIDSNDQRQLDHALSQLSGGLSGPLITIRESLISVLAELEAGLDFVEDDIEFISKNELSTRLIESCQMLARLNAQIQQRNLNRHSLSVALVGQPNAGKSSLFNALLDEPKAIVTNVEGTTRDVVTATTHWNGLEIRLIDTAGIETDASSQFHADGIESQAQQQTRRQLEQSDLIVCCIPAISRHSELDETSNWFGAHSRTATMFVITMADLLSSPERESLKHRVADYFDLPKSSQQPLVTSSMEFIGIEQLRNEIKTTATQIQHPTGSFVSATATRAADSLESAESAVQEALQAVESDVGLEIVAAELRRSLHELGTIVGTVYTDDILDQIFSRFCIGK